MKDEVFRRFVDRVIKKSDNVGAMAKLERFIKSDDIIPACTVVEALLPPYLKERQRKCFYVVAGLFACHHSDCRKGNLGKTVSLLSFSDTSAERRFLRLLGADSDEIFDMLFSVITQAKSKNISVNYERLLHDLIYWGDKIKHQWARSFYRSEVEETV